MAKGDDTAAMFDEEIMGFCREVSLDEDEVGREGGEPRQIARTMSTAMNLIVYALDSILGVCLLMFNCSFNHEVTIETLSWYGSLASPSTELHI